ncbi:hypothetical protein NQ314_011433 [Rhamnusium bicolor]|uniref:AB hydrolase-1 domain-containing protein n=1 Tax=Rhamnusium bicolor TaxID=1586634 RepID=A0AAV8XJF2_9CUCU|nr:hypothetical protein NQ314_011433 [Rhamnusium bicolor]
MIPHLKKPVNDTFIFELIIPSLPGFGYSDGSNKPKCQTPHVAHILKNLMKRLGHEKFYVHGSDWGGIVANNMATLFPKNVLGFHSNFCISLRYISIVKLILGSLYPRIIVSYEFESKLYPLRSLLRFYFAESGYLHIQGTKPDTIGISLENSPEGLLAFMLEKLSVGTNKNNVHVDNAGLDKFDKTLLMDIIMFYYWFPKSATTSGRFYAENLNVDAFRYGLHK